MRDLDDEGDGAGLELDTGRYDPPPARITAPPPKLTPATGTALHPSVVPSHAGFPMIPSFTRDEEIDFDPEELHEAARFGPVPSGFFGSASYALKVRKRTAELVAEAAKLEPAVARTRDELIEELSRLGERARVAGYKGPKEIEALLAAVEAADRNAENAEGAKSVEHRRHERQLAEIEERIEVARDNMEEPRRKEAQLAGELGNKEEERRQLEMRIKRLEISIRAAEDVIARKQAGSQPAEGDAKAVEDASKRLPALQAERQQLRTLNSHLDEPIADLRGRLERARDDMAELKAERAAATKARDDELALHEANTKGAASQSEQARQQLTLNLAEIGRAVRLDRNAPSWALEIYPPIDQCAQSYAKLWADRQRFLRAAESFDPSVVQRGYILLFGGAGVAVFLVIGLLVLVSNL
jgi:hypothetical protein